MQLKQLCYISILFPCLYFVVNAMCTLKKCLCLDLFVIVVKLCTCSTCHGTFISLDINRYQYKNKVNACTKLWLANRASQNMALAGPTAVWVASGHRASGKHDPCDLFRVPLESRGLLVLRVLIESRCRLMLRVLL